MSVPETAVHKYRDFLFRHIYVWAPGQMRRIRSKAYMGSAQFAPNCELGRSAALLYPRHERRAGGRWPQKGRAVLNYFPR
jgi:hypothetical protein